MKLKSSETTAVLYGADPTAGIVGVGLNADSTLTIYIRDGSTVTSETQPVRPFLLLADPTLIKDVCETSEIVELKGQNLYRYLAAFPTVESFEKASKVLKKKSRRGVPEPAVFINDLVHQYLLKTGRTFFKGLEFSDLSRMQVDIETYCAEGFEFPNAEREGDKVIVISMSDGSGWEKVLHGKEMTESELLGSFCEILRERDPDVIEGHNVLNFDLTYLMRRAELLGIPLSLGRDGSEPKGHRSRVRIAERNVDYIKWEIQGRSIFDTWIAVQFYDLTRREIESYGLKAVAQFFGVSPKGRTYIDGSKISRYYDDNLDELLDYALDDVRETGAIAEILAPTYFIQAQMIPYPYQNILVRGNATKIDALMLREYFRRGHSLPEVKGAQTFEGGTATIFKRGVIQDVALCDVQSLYPSLMILDEITPRRDDLGLFNELLLTLTKMRLDAKARFKEEKDDRTRFYYEHLQGTLKILINSFFGYLGADHTLFGDDEKAAEVTAKGRATLEKLIDLVRERGGTIIEVDTDGVYFQPPVGKRSENDVQEFVSLIEKEMPEGIVIEVGGLYRSMLSYKVKNYALLRRDGKLIVKGSALRSRGLERFQRDIILKAIRLALEGKAEKVPLLIEEMRGRIERREWSVEEFLKTETLSESPDVYKEKTKEKEGKRNRSAPYELALKAERQYMAGDPISYYIKGESAEVKAYESCEFAHRWDPNSPDENTTYYLKKLEEVRQKVMKIVNPSGDQSEDDWPREPCET